MTAVRSFVRSSLGRVAAAATLALAACTTTSLTQAPPPPGRGETSPPDASVAAATPVAAPSAPRAAPVVQAQPVAERPALQATLLAARPSPDSYAFREDALALAAEVAERHRLDPAWTRSVLAQAQVRDDVRRLIMPATHPGAKNWAAYRSRFIEPIRVRAGVAFWKANEPALRHAEATFGVPMDIIAGVIGVETLYGRHTGGVRVLDALATLSLDFPTGRSDRSGFFRDELGHFLRLCMDEGEDPAAIVGSFAGAMGLPQFMPSSIRRFGVDFDGDGHVDLLRSPADAIGSVAHYLAQHGWQRGMPTHYPVAPPPDANDLARLLGPDIVPSFTAPEMQQAGARLGEAGARHAGLMALVQLHNGGDAPTYVAGTDNFYALTRYNQSSYYALAVAELGQAVARAAQDNLVSRASSPAK